MSRRAGSPRGPRAARVGCECQVCAPDPAYLDPYDRLVIDGVRERGWQVLAVAEGGGDCGQCTHEGQPDHAPGDDTGPAFAYTIGLGHSAHHPDLLMSGLRHEVMQRALDEVARRVMGGLRLAPGDHLEDVLAGVPVAVEQVAESALEETVAWSGWFHRRAPEALVLVWPDRNGVFPWQPGAPAAIHDRQPAAWRVPFAHAGPLAADPPWDFPVDPDHLAFACTHVLDHGAAVRAVYRQRDAERGEDWTLLCGPSEHRVEEIRVAHIAHLVRSAPSVHALHRLALGAMAWRNDTDASWRFAPLR